MVVGGFNPIDKIMVKIGSFPQVRVKTKHIWNHSLVYLLKDNGCTSGVEISFHPRETLHSPHLNNCFYGKVTWWKFNKAPEKLPSQ